MVTPRGDFLEHRAKSIHLVFHHSSHGLLIGVAGGELQAPACSGAEASLQARVPPPMAGLPSPAVSPGARCHAPLRGRLAKASDPRRRHGAWEPNRSSWGAPRGTSKLQLKCFFF